MATLGPLLQSAEHAFGGVWSIGELAVMAARLDELRGDPHRNALFEDIHQRGWYVPVSGRDVRLRAHRNGWLTGRNPYDRIGKGSEDRIVAKLVQARTGDAKHLVVVCHCYGVPVPPVMERLFGLQRLRHVDVVYNIMNHHQRGTFVAWPGTGFVSGQLSHFLENLRSAITGVRALVAGLVQSRGYERVTVLGFSIGGQLALHVANSAPVSQAVLYCPVTSLRQTAAELGLMRYFHEPVARAMRKLKGEFFLDDLAIADPLRYDLQIAPRNLHVIVQRYDALAPVRQIEAIRSKYGEAGWYEYGGTHIVPAGASEFQAVIRRLLD